MGPGSLHFPCACVAVTVAVTVTVIVTVTMVGHRKLGEAKRRRPPWILGARILPALSRQPSQGLCEHRPGDGSPFPGEPQSPESRSPPRAT